MDVVLWSVTVLLLAIGLAGTLLPVLPGTGLILCGMLFHRFGFGSEGIGWPTLVIGSVLFVVSLGLDFLAGVVGAKLSGASKAGIIGGVLGLVAGFFFGLPGLLLGPLAGVLAGELMAGRKLVEAGRSSVGTVLGNLAGALAKFVLGLGMIAAFAIGAWR